MNLNLDLKDFAGLTFWGFLLAGTTVGFGYILSEAKERFTSLIFDEPLTPVTVVKIMGVSLGLTIGTLAFGHVLTRTKDHVADLFTKDVY